MDESLKGGGCISASISGWELEVCDWLMKEKVTFGRQKTLGRGLWRTPRLHHQLGRTEIEHLGKSLFLPGSRFAHL